MTREQPPVYDKDFGAILPDGTHIPQDAITLAVEVIEAACRYIEGLTPEQRAGLSVESLFSGLGEDR